MNRHSQNTLDKVTTGFITAALWSTSIDPEDDTSFMDLEFDENDLHPSSLVTIRNAIASFLERHSLDIEEFAAKRECNGHDPLECVGHDLFLSAAGHGTGFFDRDTGDVGDRLQDAADTVKCVDFYLDDDEFIRV